MIFPDAWEPYEAHIPEAERGDMIAAYYRRLTGGDAAERDLSCCTTAVEIMLFKEVAEDTGIDVNDPKNDAEIAAEIVAGRTPGLHARARAYLAEAPDFDPGAADELLAWLLASFVDLGRPGLAHLH